MSALPLVERRRAPGAALAAQPGGAGHVVVGHRGRLDGLQGLVGRVAPAEHQQLEKTQTDGVTAMNQRLSPQRAPPGHGRAGRLLRGRVGPGQGSRPDRLIVSVLLQTETEAFVFLGGGGASAERTNAVTAFTGCPDVLTEGRNNPTAASVCLLWIKAHEACATVWGAHKIQPNYTTGEGSYTT